MARIEQSIEVNVPLRTAYNQWTQFEEFPRFMEGVREVRQLDDGHLHWLAERHGAQVEWDSEITDQVPDQRIAWRDTSGPKHSGSISFEPLQADRTRIRMVMEFDPAVAPPASFDAERTVIHRVEQDLTRFKNLLEAQGTESGAWRGEIHQGRSTGATPGTGTGDAAGGMGKAVGQTADERRDAAQSAAFGAGAGVGATGTGSAGNMGGMGGGGSTGGLGGTGGAAGNGFSTGARQHADAFSSASSSAHAGGGASTASGQAGGTGAAGASGASGTSGTSGAGQARDHRTGGPQAWLPNLLQGWEDPMGMVRKMSEEMDQLFERFIGRPIAARTGQGGMAGKWMPSIEISQRDNALIICADLPGVKREDVHIEVLSGKLIIEGERREEGVHMTPQGYRRSERSYGRFYRMVPLPEGVDPDAVQASMRDGVLEIRIPAPPAEAKRGKRVDIRTPE